MNNTAAKIRKVREDRTIKYVFNEHELKSLAGDITQKVAKCDRWDDVKKKVAKHLKNKIDDLDLDISSMSKDYRQGHKKKTVPCVVERDYGQAEIRIYREDTMELVETYTMTADDLQQEMFDQDGHAITAPEDDTDDGALLEDEKIETSEV